MRHCQGKLQNVPNLLVRWLPKPIEGRPCQIFQNGCIIVSLMERLMRRDALTELPLITKRNPWTGN